MTAERPASITVIAILLLLGALVDLRTLLSHPAKSHWSSILGFYVFRWAAFGMYFVFVQVHLALGAGLWLRRPWARTGAIIYYAWGIDERDRNAWASWELLSLCERSDKGKSRHRCPWYTRICPSIKYVASGFLFLGGAFNRRADLGGNSVFSLDAACCVLLADVSFAHASRACATECTVGRPAYGPLTLSQGRNRLALQNAGVLGVCDALHLGRFSGTRRFP